MCSDDELAVVRLTSLVVELLHGIADARPKFAFVENELVILKVLHSVTLYNCQQKIYLFI